MLSEMNHAVKKAVVLLTSHRLNTCLAEIDRQVQERFERLIEDMNGRRVSQNG